MQKATHLTKDARLECARTLKALHEKIFLVVGQKTQRDTSLEAPQVDKCVLEGGPSPPTQGGMEPRPAPSRQHHVRVRTSVFWVTPRIEEARGQAGAWWSWGHVRPSHTSPGSPKTGPGCGVTFLRETSNGAERELGPGEGHPTLQTAWGRPPPASFCSGCGGPRSIHREDGGCMGIRGLGD